MKTPGFFRQLSLIFFKELSVEKTTRARSVALVGYGALSLLVFSFAVGPEPVLLTRLAAGFLWLALMLASTLGVHEGMQYEMENQALEGLRLLPVDWSAFFVGKALAQSLFIFMLSCFLLPVVLALYGAELSGSIGQLVSVLALGSLALSAPGLIVAAIAVKARSKDVVLPLLLFPLLVPGLLAAVKATSLLLLGDPMQELYGWLGLLCAFAVVYWALGAVLIEKVVEA